jgi:hypothetical protein
MIRAFFGMAPVAEINKEEQVPPSEQSTSVPPSTSPSRAQSPHLTFAPEPAQTVPPMPDDDDGLALEEASGKADPAKSPDPKPSPKAKRGGKKKGGEAGPKTAALVLSLNDGPPSRSADGPPCRSPPLPSPSKRSPPSGSQAPMARNVADRFSPVGNASPARASRSPTAPQTPTRDAPVVPRDRFFGLASPTYQPERPAPELPPAMERAEECWEGAADYGVNGYGMWDCQTPTWNQEPQNACGYVGAEMWGSPQRREVWPSPQSGSPSWAPVPAPMLPPMVSRNGGSARSKKKPEKLSDAPTPTSEGYATPTASTHSSASSRAGPTPTRAQYQGMQFSYAVSAAPPTSWQKPAAFPKSTRAPAVRPVLDMAEAPACPTPTHVDVLDSPASAEARHLFAEVCRVIVDGSLERDGRLRWYESVPYED